MGFRYWLSGFIWRRTHFFRAIGRICAWVPVLWNDEEWDHGYLMKIMQFKLSRMRKYFIRSTVSDENVTSAVEIQEVEECLGRLLNDDYCQDLWDAHHKKYPIEDKWVREPAPDGSGRIGMFLRSTAGTPEGDEVGARIEKSAKMRNDDWDLLYKLLRENMEGWWD